MFCSEHFVRHHKRQTDHIIHQAYARLAAAPSFAVVFEQLLQIVRTRAAGILRAPIVNGRHPGVEALVNLSRFETAHVRQVNEWAGATSSWRLAVSCLAHHLVCTYQVPRFLTSSWYSSDIAADEKRRWFVAHGRGARFRSLDLPIVMTRKMEHIFLASPDHLSIEEAIRRAELIGLGAPAELVNAILCTRLATDLSNGEFWRTVWLFLIQHANRIEQHQIAPVIDFLQAIRHDRLRVETPNGILELDPPQPAFSMKGRTVESIMRLVGDWHRKLALGGTGLAWTTSHLRPMLLEEPSYDTSAPPTRWHVTELTTSAQLRTEGAALHHCVASYADRCHRGMSRIWSVRLQRGEQLRPVLTIEIDPKRRVVVQARGWANRPASGRPLQLLQDWAARERLQLAI